ncbi:site-2 protease family protein, partial [Dolichospermum sp. ST_sed4]|nr:site-2 protease family protein [Dolichospermum sp. ST_sed4]
QKWGPAMVAMGGPGINLLVAFVAATAARFIALPLHLKKDIINHFNDWGVVSGVISGSVGAIFYELLIIVVIINVYLAIFNLFPITPLDGSKLLFAIFPIKIETQAMLEQFGFMLLLFFIFFFSSPLVAILGKAINAFLRVAL